MPFDPDNIASDLEVFGIERRRSPRTLTVLRVVRVVAGHERGLARLVNISDHGLRIATRLDLLIGDEIAVDLSDRCSLSGRVIWRTPEHCAIRFLVPIDCVALLRRLAKDRATEERTAFGLVLDKPILARSELGLQTVRLRHIAPRAVRIAHDGRLRPGMLVKLTIAPSVECHGVIHASLDGVAEVDLLRPLNPDQLGSMRALS